MLSKLQVVKNLSYIVKISMGQFYIFFRWFGCKFIKARPVLKAAGREKLVCLTAHGRNMHRQIQRVELICRVLICKLLGFVQISVGQNDFESNCQSGFPSR